MGGKGSGNYWHEETSERPKAFACKRLSVSMLLKEGFFDLKRGADFQVYWNWGSQPAGEATCIAVSEEAFLLSYRFRIGGGEWESVLQPIKIERTPCHFGGSRAWLVCLCGKRVGCLYGAGKYFLCRACYNIRYASTCESDRNRLLSKLHKMRDSLGDSGSYADWFPDKPKRMRWKTYSELKAAYKEMYRTEEVIANEEFYRENARMDRFFKERGISRED